MAFLLTRNETFIVISGNEARIFSSASSSSSFSDLSLIARISCEDSASTEASESVAVPEHQSEEAGESSVIPGQILSAALSHSGDLLALCDDYKKLRVWQLSDTSKGGPSLLCETTLARRSTALTFSPTDDSVLVADKNGDAYSVQIQQSGQEAEPKRILGHLGMLLDIGVTACGKYVLTCDRDEKIRASHFPNAYNIHNFYLAHTQFVYRLCIPGDLSGHFISGGGDGCVIFWSLENPRPLFVLNTIEDAQPTIESASNGDAKSPSPDPLQVKCLQYSRGHLCVSFNEFDLLLVYRVCVTDSGISASLVQTLRLSSNVLDCVFVKRDELVILTAEKPLFRRFRLAERNDVEDVNDVREKTPFVEIESPTLSFIDDDGDSLAAFESSLNVAAKTPSIFSILTKSKIDNMKAYLETKEKRLAGGNARWGGHKKSAEEPVECGDDAKKLKLKN